MKNAIYRVFPFLLITGFLMYWVSIFLLALPSNYVKDILIKAAPRYNSLFGNSWKLFSPPYTYSNRLYYIVKEIAHPYHADTIEVIENIIKQKQLHAPFNQRENIIDHLVHHDMGMIIYIVWKDKTRPLGKYPGTTDSVYIANAVAAVADNTAYLNSRATLLNYGNVVLKEHNIDTAGKEIKMIITQKKIQPFKYMDDTSLIQKETIYVETPYNPVKKW